MVVPENPNNRPELPDAGSAEAQAANNLQQDVQFDSVNLGDLDNAFAGGNDSAANVFGDVAISDQRSAAISDSTATEDRAATNDIASMTREELEAAITQQRAYVNGIENQIATVTQANQAGDLKQRADKVAEADAYFDSGLS